MKIMKKGLILLMMLSAIVTCSFITASADELETDKKTGLATPESVWNNYIDNTKDIVENDTELNQWMEENFNNDNTKKRYIKNYNKASEEKWDSFSTFEKFNCSVLAIDEKMNLNNRNFKDEDDFWDEYTYYEQWAKNTCKTSENIEPFFDEVEKVVRWQYQYYEKTNNTYDFFAGSEEEVTTENLEDDSEYQDIKNALLDEDETDANINDDKDGEISFATIILIIVVVIVIIGGVTIVFIKNKNDE